MKTLSQVSLNGLTMAPAQVYGSIRMIPLLRDHDCEQLRLAARRYPESVCVVNLSSPKAKNQVNYTAFVPHGLVVAWGHGDQPAASFGTHLVRRDGKVFGSGDFKVRIAHKLVKRESGRQLRLLPLHLAFEGYLAQHFNGPGQAWSEYSREARSRGLSPRFETTFSGRSVFGLTDAIRVFEIHERQCGVILCVGDQLASVFVLPNSADYRALHASLIQDFYCDTILQNGYRHRDLPELAPELGRLKITRSAELHAALALLRQASNEVQSTMTRELFSQPISSERVYKLGQFHLFRFNTELKPTDPNHLGECIVDSHGDVLYLKSYRLSVAQTKRAYLLDQLAKHKWDLEATAAAFGSLKSEFILRMRNAGFGYLLLPEVIKQAQAKHR